MTTTMTTVKPFCIYHIKTRENPNETDCTAHMNEGRVFECSYNAKDIKFDEKGMYISHGDRYQGACGDFELSDSARIRCAETLSSKGLKKHFVQSSSEQRAKLLIDILNSV